MGNELSVIDAEVLRQVMLNGFTDQRELSRRTGISLGRVSQAVTLLQAEGWLSPANEPMEKAKKEAERLQPKNAVILAAGFGLRMVPVGHEIPKGMIEIAGVPMIERLILQLREAGVEQITIVVGFMKESYEYLIDKYQVRMIRNRMYDKKNSYYSLYLAREELGSSYIVPCDLYCDENPFRALELYPWYMVSEEMTENSNLRVNRKRELAETDALEGNRMLGLAYVTPEAAARLREGLEVLEADPRLKDAYWELAAMENHRMGLNARLVSSDTFHEINTYEELRELDRHSRHLESQAITLSAKALDAEESEIEEIRPMKLGMTNRSFSFVCRGQKYIMRIPGEGTDVMINRQGEKEAYDAVSPLGISDEVLYFDAKTGFKLSRFIENAVMCDYNQDEDVVKMFRMLHWIHGLKLKTNTFWDIYRELERYESLWEGKPSAFRDYQEVREKIYSLRPYIEAHKKEAYLAHMDPAGENFLKVQQPDGSERIYLLDWEYASMHDQLFDLVEFCLYTGNDKVWVDHMIDLYFETAGETCDEETRTLIYCYMSAVGFMWTAWCEAKRYMGVDFMDYSLNQYRYAKDFYQYAVERMEEVPHA